MDNAQLIARGKRALQTVWDMDTPTLLAQSSEDRFNYITSIKKGLYAQFPAPPDDPMAEISRESIEDRQLGVLHRLINSLRLSDDYHEFIISITKQATEDFTSNTQYVAKLLNWENLGDEEKLSLVQEFHNTVIHSAKLALDRNKANMGLSHSVKPLTVYDFYDDPTETDDGYETVVNGYAGLDHKKWPGVDVIAVNTHERSSFGSAEDAIETIAHESAHIIEGYLAFTFGHHAPFIPEKFRADAELLYHMYDKEAYIMARIPSAYRNQANEVVAREAGETARNIISKAMQLRV